MSLVASTLFRHEYVPPANLTLRKIDQDEIDRKRREAAKAAQRDAALALRVPMKEKTRREIVSAIREGHLTMDSISLRTGLAKTTVMNHLNELLEEKVVTADKRKAPFVFRMGRKAESIEVTK
jgi:DNA-binding transcriptional ArsR family regulator